MRRITAALGVSLVTLCCALATMVDAPNAWALQLADRFDEHPKLFPTVEATHQQVAVEAEALWAQQRAAARPVELVAPYFSLRDHTSATLYLLNTITDPVIVEISVHNPAGERLPLGTRWIDANRHLALSLNEILHFADETFLQGSLVLSFLGARNTLQAWLLVEDKGQYLEMPLQMPGQRLAQQFVSFWDVETPTIRNAGPAFYLVNRGATPVEYRLALGSATNTAGTSKALLLPGEQHRIDPLRILARPVRRGWLRIQHDGEAGTVLGLGLLRQGDAFMALPWLSPSELAASSEFVSMVLPPGITGGSLLRPASTRLTLLNPGAHEQQVTQDMKAWSSPAGSTS